MLRTRCEQFIERNLLLGLRVTGCILVVFIFQDLISKVLIIMLIVNMLVKKMCIEIEIEFL